MDLGRSANAPANLVKPMNGIPMAIPKKFKVRRLIGNPMDSQLLIGNPVDSPVFKVL
jgi:hypothetical protein